MVLDQEPQVLTVRIIGVFLGQKLTKTFTVIGDGNQRDFTYVSDVVDAIIKSAKSKVKIKSLI